MKMKKWLKCLLMTMAFMMAVNVGTLSTTIPAAAAKAETQTIGKGTTFWKSNLQYKITSLKGKKGIATLIGAKSNVTSVTVPKTVKKGNYTLTVTAIGANAFKNCKKLEAVTTNTVLKKIGKNAFKGCEQLAEVDIQSKALTKVGKDALKGISEDAVVTVPEGKETAYEKILNVSVQISDAEESAELVQEPEKIAAPAQEPQGVPTVQETQGVPTAQEPQGIQNADNTVAETASTIEEQQPGTEKVTEAPETKAQDEESEAETSVETTPEAKAPTQTEAPTEAETEAPKATPAPETEAPKATPAPETKAPKAAPAPETEAPKATPAPETEAPKATPAPETEASKAAPAPETKAPVQRRAAAKPAQKNETAAPTPEVKTPATEAQTQTETETAAQTEPTAVPTPETQPQPETNTKAAVPETTPEPTPETPVQTESETPEATEPATEATAPAETEHVCKFTWVVTKDPYCGYLGYDMTWRDTGSRTGTCEVCGKTVKEGLRAEHVFGDDSYTAPTCTADGYYKCAVCGYKVTENAEKALGHDMEHIDVPPTCTEDGYSYDQCRRCGKIADKKVTDKKLGHDYTGEVTVLKAATCLTDGQQVTACAREGCTATWSKRIPKLEHEFQKEEFPATCTENAKTVTTCRNCTYKEVEVKYGTAHHNLVEEEQVAANGERSVYKVMVCMADGCDYKEVVETDLTSHSSHNAWMDVEEFKAELEKTGMDTEELEKLPLSQGVLAANSVIDGERRIRTEICTECFYLPERKYEFRYAYQENGMGAWIPWEMTTCYKNGKGHTWDETLHGKDGMSTLCSVCGMTKPAAQGLGRSMAWDASFTASSDKCVGFKLPTGGVYPTALLTSKADYPLTVEAPEAKPGYEFKKWTWETVNGSGESADRKLTVPCDLMNVVFTAHYAEEGQTESAVELQEDKLEAENVPQIIHEELHVDLAGVLDGDQPAAGHEEHEIVDQADPLVESEDTAAIAE